MKKLISMLLLLTVILAVLVACAGDDPAAQDGKETTAAQSSGTAPPDKPPLGLPEDLHFDGYDFTILAVDENVPYTYFEIATDLTGSVMNDAVYNRNLAVQDLLGVNFNVINVTAIRNVITEVRKSVNAGDGSYDLISPHIIAGIASMAAEGFLNDFNEINHVDFDRPYWNQTFAETLAINGKLFYAAGDIIVPNARVIVFNKQMMTDLNKPDIYDVIRNGRWTLDKMIEYSADVLDDINGDTIYDSQDRYPFADLSNTGLASSFIHGCDILFVEKTNDGFIFNMPGEKMISVVTKLYDYYYKDGRITATNADFGQGRVLFGTQVLLKLQVLRDYETDFGIIPFPKYDESQKSYISTVWNGLLAVPIDAKDTDCSGAVLEALAYHSSDTLKPAYRDALLESIFARDEESGEMLGLIFDGVVYDMGMCFDMCFDGGIEHFRAPGQILRSGSLNIASHFAANESVYTNNYNKIFNSIK